jgi:hypothetical protein
MTFASPLREFANPVLHLFFCVPRCEAVRFLKLMTDSIVAKKTERTYYIDGRRVETDAAEEV